jgi:hypothetical protein
MPRGCSRRLHTRETQQFFTDFTAQYSAHAQVQSNRRRKITDIKLMKEDAAGVEAMAEEIKTRHARLFRVTYDRDLRSQPRNPHRLTKPVLWMFHVLIALILLPMSWLAVFAFTTGRQPTLQISSPCSAIPISSIRY